MRTSILTPSELVRLYHILVENYKRTGHTVPSDAELMRRIVSAVKS